MRTVQESCIGTDPAVIFNHDTFAPRALVPDGDIHTVVVVVFGVKRDVLPHDHIFAD
jgi:hypothetical protein